MKVTCTFVGLFFSKSMSCNEYLLHFLFCPIIWQNKYRYIIITKLWNFIIITDITDLYGQREITLKNVKVISVRIWMILHLFCRPDWWHRGPHGPDQRTTCQRDQAHQDSGQEISHLWYFDYISLSTFSSIY